MKTLLLVSLIVIVGLVLSGCGHHHPSAPTVLVSLGTGTLEGQLVAAMTQVITAHILHGEVVESLMLTDVIDGDDMGMDQLADDSRLAQKALTETGIGGEHGRHHLQRHLASKALLNGEIDRCHAATAQFADDAIAWNLDIGTGCVIHLPPTKLRTGPEGLLGEAWCDI